MVGHRRYINPGTGTVRVLVVKSFWIEREIVGAVLEEQLGWEVVVANRGDKALELLKSQRFDLVVTDVAMSNDSYNGFGLIRHINVDEQLTVPIMVVTNRLAPEIRATAHELGVDVFINAPFEDDYLVVRAVELVKSARSE